MDSPQRSPPLDSDDLTTAVTGSTIQSPPAGNPLAPRAVTGFPVPSPATNDSIVSRGPAVRAEAVTEHLVRSLPTSYPLPPRAPAVRNEAVTEYPVRSPPTNNPLAPRAPAVREEAKTEYPVRLPPTNNPLPPRAPAVRDEAVTEFPVRSPPTNNPLAPRALAVREEVVTEHPVRLPPTNNPLAPRATAVLDKTVTGSSVRSQPTTPSPAARQEAVTGSPLRSPSHHSQPKENTNAFFPRPRTWIIPDESVTESTVRSPSPSAEKNQVVPTKDTTVVTGSPIHSPQTNSSLSSRDSTPRYEVTRSPVWSPEKEAMVTVPPASILSDETVTGSPVNSPHHEAIKYEKQNSFYSVSSNQSPNRDVDNPNAQRHKETIYTPPLRGAMTVGSLIGSPLGDETTEDPTSLEKATSPMMPMANRMVASETTSTPKVGGRNGATRGLTRVEEGALRLPVTRKIAVGLRIVALALSLISFSIMAADKTYGWDGDSFDRYIEFRYCLSINVLVFAYSFFQVFVQLHHKIKKRRIMSRPISYSFDLLMDQILAYLLMSASSAAASRNGDWVANFGSDDFTKKINASIVMSFLAFFALAVSSIISAYKFFSWKY